MKCQNKNRPSPCHHNHFMALFPGPHEWASARRELLDFMVQGKINRDRHTDRLARRHSIRLTSAYLHQPPIFFTDRVPFLPPNQQCTEHLLHKRWLHLALVFWATVCKTVRPMLSVTPLPSNRHHRRCGDCLEGKGENYQVCSVQYCVQQLCTVRCTHIWTH